MAGEWLRNQVCRILAASLMLSMSSQKVYSFEIDTAPASSDAIVHGRVANEKGRPVPGVYVRLGITVVEPNISVRTDSHGEFEIPLQAGEYHVWLKKRRFAPVVARTIIVHSGKNHLRFTLHSGVSDRQAESNLLKLAAPSEGKKAAKAGEDTPEKLPDVSQVLVDRYSEIRSPGTQGSAGKYLVDRPVDADPQSFGLMNTLNQESVHNLNIEARSGTNGNQKDYAQPEHVIAVEQHPSPHWEMGLNHLIPSLRVQDGIRLGDWAPKFTWQAPFVGDRLWISDTTSANHELVVVPGLPRGAESMTGWQDSNLMRTQWTFSPTHVIDTSVLAEQENDDHIGLSPFTPLSATVNLGVQRLRFTGKDQHAWGSQLLEMGISLEQMRSELTPQGGTPYILLPGSAAGSYFETLRGNLQSGQLFSNYRFPGFRFLGKHEFQLGASISASKYGHHAIRNPFEIVDANGNVLQLTYFIGDSDFSLSNTRPGTYIQDVWSIGSRLRIEPGLRYDYDRIVGNDDWSPRIGFAWLPSARLGTKLFGFSGVYYPLLDLGLLGQANDQLRIDAFYGNGQAQGAPQTADFTASFPKLSSPHYITSKLGVEQQIALGTFVGSSVLWHSQRAGLAYQKLAAKQNQELLPLLNNRKDDYRGVEVSFRQKVRQSAEVLVSYTRSYTHTNQLFDYDFASQTFTNQYEGPLDSDAPNRIVSWGWTPLLRNSVFLSYLLEYRTGFPFSIYDENYNLVGQPNQQRFPDFFRLNMGIEKALTIKGQRVGVRLAVVNLTGHGNYTVVDNNTASPTFMTFAGALSRSYTVRLRLIGEN